MTSACAAVALGFAAPAAAAPLSGAIFTTDATGVPVNLNIYENKQDVYLNGGPGINAPDDAAGLPAGTYSFQVTDPSGKTLLSTDLGITVQLFPFADTPNNGGVYKVWVSPTDLLDCTAPGNKNCFVPRYSKTDNFKVREGAIIEVDTRFSREGVAGYIDGLGVTWTDTLGAGGVVTVPVKVSSNVTKDATYFVDVLCAG